MAVVDRMTDTDPMCACMMGPNDPDPKCEQCGGTGRYVSDQRLADLIASYRHLAFDRHATSRDRQIADEQHLALLCQLRAMRAWRQLHGGDALSLSNDLQIMQELRDEANARAERAEADRDSWQKACMEAREGCNQRSDALASMHRSRDEVLSAIGSTRWMDPPDGGDVTVAEQVRRMRADLERAEAELASPPRLTLSRKG